MTSGYSRCPQCSGGPGSAQNVKSDCWGPWKSADTYIVVDGNKNDKVTSGHPLCPQCPGGPESAQNVKT